MWEQAFCEEPLNLQKKCLFGELFLGRPVEQVAAPPPDVPAPQDTTEVAALLDGLRDENCVLVEAIRHELSVQISREPAEVEVVHYTPQLTQGNMHSTDLYRRKDSYDNSDEICCYMADVLAPEEVTDIEQKMRDPNRDLALWKCMQALRISASTKAHTVPKSRKEHNILAKVLRLNHDRHYSLRKEATNFEDRSGGAGVP